MTPRELASDHAARRRARVAQIRRTVAAVAVCLFIVLFSGIYVQMARGHDPALGAKAAVTKKASTSTSSSGTSSASSTPSDSPSSGSPDSASGSSSSQSQSPVTTSQS